MLALQLHLGIVNNQWQKNKAMMTSDSRVLKRNGGVYFLSHAQQLGERRGKKQTCLNIIDNKVLKKRGDILKERERESTSTHYGHAMHEK